MSLGKSNYVFNITIVKEKPGEVYFLNEDSPLVGKVFSTSLLCVSNITKLFFILCVRSYVRSGTAVEGFAKH